MDNRLEKQIKYLEDKIRLNKDYLKFCGDKRSESLSKDELDLLEGMEEDLKDLLKLKKACLKFITDFSDAKTLMEIKSIAIKM